MTGESFFEYIGNVFIPFLKESETPLPVVVFLDGHKFHLSLNLSILCSENKIILVSLFPNATHILQPLDVAVFGPMKKNIIRQWRIDHDGREIKQKYQQRSVNLFMFLQWNRILNQALAVQDYFQSHSKKNIRC